MSELSIGEMLTELVEHGEFAEHEQRLLLVIQGIAHFHKRRGFLSSRQRATVISVWEVRQKRKDEKARGIKYNLIPDDFFQQTAARRKGHPRNKRPYKTQQDYEANEHSSLGE